MKIAFFGTGDFSKNILASLLNYKELEIVAVVSQPDKQVGRKKILTETPVKILAKEYDIPVFQPKSLKKDEELVATLKKLELDFIIVVAYGKIMPMSILDIPKYGSINIHGSLLPAYRGASPIQEAIKNGDTKTGVTIMYMSAGMDEGDMLAKAEVAIKETDTTPDIFHKFETVAPDLLVQTLRAIQNGNANPEKQDDTQASYCSKIEKTDGKINFANETAKQIYDKARAFTPWPGVYHYYEQKKFGIEMCSYEDITLDDEAFQPGDVVEIENEHGEKHTKIGVVCTEGILILESVKPEGKKTMDIASFINGNKEFLDWSFT